MRYPPAQVIEVNREPSALHNQVTDVLLLGSAGDILNQLLEAIEVRVEARAV